MTDSCATENKPLPDVDLADFNHLVPLSNHGAAAFAGFARGLAEKLTNTLPDEENPLKQYRIGFYLQDRPDPSPARICSREYRSDSADLSGRDFIVMFNREKMTAIKSEDELAFVLGHELSHLSWHNGSQRIRALSTNEETACDLNAIEMLHDAGYDVRVAVSMDQNMPLTEEWRQRREARKEAVNKFFDFRRSVPLDQTAWQEARYEKWQPDFRLPSLGAKEEDAVAMMVENLQKVYTNGGGEDFQKILKNYVNEKGSEQGSRFFLLLAAAAAEQFPPIDQQTGGDYRTRLRHPVRILGDVLPTVAAMSGKKLFPPAVCAKLNTYFNENPDYYRTMKVFWDKVLPTGHTSPSYTGGRSGR